MLRCSDPFYQFNFLEKFFGLKILLFIDPGVVEDNIAFYLHIEIPVGS
jgi:hypothetical protein